MLTGTSLFEFCVRIYLIRLIYASLELHKFASIARLASKFPFIPHRRIPFAMSEKSAGEDGAIREVQREDERMLDVVIPIGVLIPTAPSSPPIPSASAPSQARKRNGPSQMKLILEEDRREGRNSIYGECKICNTYYTIVKKHACKLKNLCVPTKDSKPVTSYTSEKAFLSSSLATETKVEVLQWIRARVENQHAIKYLASYCMHGFIIHQLQRVSFDTIERDINERLASEVGLLLHVNQSSIRTTLSLCGANPNKSQNMADPIRMYYKNIFSKRVDNITSQLKSAEYLAATSLQACAVELKTSFQNMMEAQLWRKTKYWSRLELEDILAHDDMIPFAFLRSSSVLNTIKYWLATYLWCDRHLEFTATNLQTEVEAREFFINHMKKGKATKKYCIEVEHIIGWDALWTRMYPRFVKYIQTTLFTLEWSFVARAAANRKWNKEHPNEKVKEEDMPSKVASLRCVWLYAILKRLEQIEEAHLTHEGRSRSRGTNSNKVSSSRVKLYHLFPLTGFVPAHIEVDEKMLMAMDKYFYDEKLHLMKNMNADDPRKSIALPPPTDKSWRRYFNRPDKFWFDASTKRSCSCISTDGFGASFLKGVVKMIAIQTVERAPFIRGSIKRKSTPVDPIPTRASRLPYHTSETLESLEAKNVVGIAAIDLNRKNFMVLVFRMIEFLIESNNSRVTDAARSGEVNTRDSKDKKVKISKAEYKHVRGITRAQQERSRLAINKFSTANDAQVFLCPPSIKGTSTDLIEAWKTFMNAEDRMWKCLEFYRHRRFREMRMESYANEQKLWVYIQDKIYRELSTAEVPLHNPRLSQKARRDEDGALVAPTKNRLMIALGDGGFAHNSKGHITMPSGSKFFDRLEYLNEYVRWVDEFNTSKCCSSCGEVTEGAGTVKKERGKKNSTNECDGCTVIIPPAPPDPPPPELDGRHHSSRPRWTKISATSDSSSTLCRYPKAHIPRSLTQCSYLSSPSARASQTAELITVDSSISIERRWGLRVCFSQQCRNRIWCRDVNADKNMLHRVGMHLTYGTIPQHLQREEAEPDEPTIEVDQRPKTKRRKTAAATTAATSIRPNHNQLIGLANTLVPSEASNPPFTAHTVSMRLRARVHAYLRAGSSIVAS
jgi:hypothetical protein